MQAGDSGLYEMALSHELPDVAGADFSPKRPSFKKNRHK
jgi:hypothetical protein